MPVPYLIPSFSPETGENPNGVVVRNAINHRLGQPALRRLIDLPRADISTVHVLGPGDSTFSLQDNTIFTTPYWLGLQIAAVANAEGWRVEQRVARTTVGGGAPVPYDYFSTKVLAAGSGPRGYLFSASNTRQARFINNALQRTSDDVEVIVGFDPASLAPAAVQVITAAENANSGGALGEYNVSIQTSGRLRLTWFAGQVSGSQTTQFVEWNLSDLGVTSGTPNWVKLTLDVDNGSGGWTATAARALNWYDTTASVTPVVLNYATAATLAASSVSPTAAVTSVGKPDGGVMSIGGRSSSALNGGVVEPFLGTVYGALHKDGLSGPHRCTVNIDDWQGVATAGTYLASTPVGSATYMMYCCGAPGKNIDWYLGTFTGDVDSLRLSRLIPPYADVVTIDNGHNESSKRGTNWKTSLDLLDAAIAARVPMATKHLMMQNETSSDLPGRISLARRQQEAANYLGGKGYTVTDCLSALYTADQTVAPLANTTQPGSGGNVHPASLGYQVLGQTMAGEMGLAPRAFTQ